MPNEPGIEPLLPDPAPKNGWRWRADDAGVDRHDSAEIAFGIGLTDRFRMS
ncbi:hypothetical protein ACIQWA_01975 [Kitasatospora sp. NPDC098652]|uniref:hypothetical protein n=1 Tax=Kitasatospora sp. NPDC098652 TaxID=3364095 RepID=UPI0037F3956F